MKLTSLRLPAVADQLTQTSFSFQEWLENLNKVFEKKNSYVKIQIQSYQGCKGLKTKVFDKGEVGMKFSFILFLETFVDS